MSKQAEGAALTTTGVAAMVQYLEAEGVAYELVEPEQTMSAAAEAAAAGRPAERVAKTVVLQEGPGYVLSVIPASERLDLHKVREVLGASRKLQLATEEQIGRDFPQFEVGAAPPFGPLMPRAEVVDRRLLEQDRILCAAGDHTHSLLVDPRDLVRLTDAHTADICQD